MDSEFSRTTILRIGRTQRGVPAAVLYRSAGFRCAGSVIVHKDAHYALATIIDGVQHSRQYPDRETVFREFDQCAVHECCSLFDKNNEKISFT